MAGLYCIVLVFFNCEKTRLNEEQKLLSKGYKQEDAGVTSYYDVLLRAKWFLVVDENDPVTSWWDCKVLLKTDDRVLLIKFSKPTGKEVVLWCKEENFLFTTEGLKVNFCINP